MLLTLKRVIQSVKSLISISFIHINQLMDNRTLNLRTADLFSTTSDKERSQSTVQKTKYFK